MVIMAMNHQGRYICTGVRLMKIAGVNPRSTLGVTLKLTVSIDIFYTSGSDLPFVVFLNLPALMVHNHGPTLVFLLTPTLYESSMKKTRRQPKKNYFCISERGPYVIGSCRINFINMCH